ncbi:MAG: family 10 glycosylhydrolase, partial [Bacillota bacterium]
MTRNARKWVLLLALFALAVSPEGLAQTGVGAPGGRIPVGIWMDIGSIPHDSGGIRKIVDDLADMGILDVYAQVFNRGLTIYPSAVAAGYGLPAQRGTFAGLDPLKDLIEHAHLRGLRVHAWLDVLYVGYKERGALLDRYPSWETVARDGSRGHGPPGNQQLTSLSPRV